MQTTQSDMTKLVVGEKFPSSTPASDGAYYEFDNSGHALKIFAADLSAHEIKAIRKGRAIFGVYEKDGILFLLSKFGDMDWMDAPYHAGLYDINRRPEIVELTENSRAFLQVFLVDTQDGKLKGMRGMTLGRMTTQKIYQIAERQLQAGISQSEYQSSVSRAMIFSSDQMAQAALVVEEAGSENV